MKTFRIFAIELISVIASGCTSQNAVPSATHMQDQRAVIEGKRLWELGKLDEAEVKFQKVLAVDTNNAAAAYYLALVHREQIEHRRPAMLSYHKTLVTNYLRMPLEQRSLASFGQFDASTTVEDVINRVGPPDADISISGIHSISYILPFPETNDIQITSPGGSFITSVVHGKTVLYERDKNEW